jgi:hypothetical protein
MTVDAARIPPIPSGTRVRYIKLGQGGGWEDECIRDGIIRWGFGVERTDRFAWCMNEQWDELAKSFEEEGKDKKTATSYTNQTRIFFEDDGSTLWITFHERTLYWCRLDKSTRPALHDNGVGVWRPVAGAWRCTDQNGRRLTTDHLAGSSVTKFAQYRGTSCIPGGQKNKVHMAEDVIRWINGQNTP